jgi:hypothetical protein
MADIKSTPYLISSLATGIYRDEFDEDSGFASLDSISGWLETHLGLLNTRIYTEFSGSGSIDGDTYIQPSGEFRLEEADIYKQIYLVNFYTKKTRSVLRGIDSSVDFVTLREGDSMITRTNKNEIAKTYRGLAKDAEEKLVGLIYSYNDFKSQPVQVAGSDTYLSTGTSTYYFR